VQRPIVLQANIKSDEIREQLLAKGFTGPAPGKIDSNQSRPASVENMAPAAPSSVETKLKSLQNRMKRRNALHVRNGDTESDIATQAAENGQDAAEGGKNQQQIDAVRKTPVRNRESACSLPRHLLHPRQSCFASHTL
jgi:hypothetical protein